MKVIMSKSIAPGLLGAGAILLAILLTGCSDAPSPTPSAGAVPTPTVTAQPGVTPVPTPTMVRHARPRPTRTSTPGPTPAPTMAPTHMPTPMPTPAPTIIVDDHGNEIDDATAIRVGADVRGALDYDGDIDYLRFQAEQGESYQIDVALGTLDDSMVYLYDADGSFLDTNDDYVGTSASRLYWEAPSNGVYYVAVTGFFGVGTYTVTVSIIDDRGNGFESATRIAIGEAVAIELEDLDEEDVLVFLAEPGRDYVITLDWESYQVWDNPGSIMALYDAGGQELARLEEFRLFFEQNSEQDNVASCDRRGLLHCSRGRKYAWHFHAHRNRRGSNGTVGQRRRHGGPDKHPNAGANPCRSDLIP